MAVTQRDYSNDLVNAAKSVLLELVRVLGEYQNQIVVVGGWVGLARSIPLRASMGAALARCAKIAGTRKADFVLGQGVCIARGKWPRLELGQGKHGWFQLMYQEFFQVT